MKQISIVGKKQPAMLTKVAEALAAQHINIESLDIQTFAESEVIVLSVDKYDAALQAIHHLPDMDAVSEDAILIRLPHEAGAVARIARRFSDAQIAIRSMRFIQRDDCYGLVAIATERSDEALQLVADVLVA